MKYCYIVTEGVHDIEFLAKVIKQSFGLSRIQQRSSVDSFWEELIPKTFPIDDDLLKRVPVPLFIQNDQYSIALHNARGITKIANTLEESLSVIDQSKLFSIGLILDADDQDLPSKRFQDLIQELLAKQSLTTINFQSATLEKVSNGSPKFGVFIFPNNQDSGTLEDILIECAKVNYSELLKSAEEYIQKFDKDHSHNLRSELKSEELKDFDKPSGKNKAIISTISSVLKPGKAIQVSIQDNRWIDNKTIQLSYCQGIQQFLKDLMN